MKPDFFLKLYEDRDFCAGLGQVVLAAGRLESMLRQYLAGKGVTIKEREATLGRLTSILKDRELLTRNGEMHFSDLTFQRNYLTHKLFDLFSEKIEESILPRTNLEDGDVDYFTERAVQLASDLDHFATSVHKLVTGTYTGKSNVFRTMARDET